MSKQPRNTVWPAPEHTLAKIAILRAYLQAWFTILGTTVPKDMLYKILNKMRDRHGIESIVIGGKVVTSLPIHIQWADADKIKFRDRLASPVTGLFGQE